MKKIVIACDSFKESMSATVACQAIEKGIKDGYHQNIETILLPLADGGEGSAKVIGEAMHLPIVSVDTCNPYLEKMKADYYFDNDKKLAIIEVASSCGIDLIDKEKRNPTKALSYGFGTMIKDAIKRGSQEIVLCLGGSVTNDGGYGMLQALGAVFYDQNKQELPLTIDAIEKVKSIDISKIQELLGACKLNVASDVTNYFVGAKGATYTFGPQKGATQSQLEYLEHSLLSFNEAIKSSLQIDLSTIEKTGSAGGIGGALYCIGATLCSGIDLILELVNFKEVIKDTDYIFTGEGSIDGQTIQGKTISGVAKMAKLQQIPVIALAGRVTSEASNLYDIGVTAMFSITNEAKELKQALLDGEISLIETTRNIIKLIK